MPRRLNDIIIIAFIVVMTAFGAAPASSGGSAANQCDHDFSDDMWSDEYRTWLVSPPLIMKKGWQDQLFVRAPPDCRETFKEIAAIFALTSQRASLQAAINDEIYHPEVGMEPVLRFKINDIFAVRLLVGLVLHETLIAVLHFKNKFKRARPWQLDPSIKPTIAFPKHASYPSGHATQATAVAMALARILPDCREKLLKAGRQVGINREVAGVHYRSDTQAGERLAAQVMALIVPLEDYRKLEEDAREAIKGKGPCLK